VKVKVSRVQLRADIYAHTIPTKKVADSYVGELLAIVPVNGRVCYVIAGNGGVVSQEYVSDWTRIEVVQ